MISGLSHEGERGAMTASSVTSISDQPPSLLVCVNQAARMDYILRHSDHFCINILSSLQQELSQVCATPDLGEERFEVGQWHQHEARGLHYVKDAPAVFLCEKQQQITHGTHTIYIGNIEEVLVSNEKNPALVYADGRYHHV